MMVLNLRAMTQLKFRATLFPVTVFGVFAQGFKGTDKCTDSDIRDIFPLILSATS